MDQTIARPDVGRGDQRSINAELVVLQDDRGRLAVDGPGSFPLANVGRGLAAADNVVVQQRDEFFLVLGLEQAFQFASRTTSAVVLRPLTTW